jgi:hypothetical protein
MQILRALIRAPHVHEAGGTVENRMRAGIPMEHQT